jgi:sugar-specific transcriptional regulator TrmB
MNVDLNSVTEELTLLGLDHTSAKIYTMLLLIGTASARELTKQLGIDRVKTYRALKHLRNYGLIESIIGNPTLFKPIEPLRALHILLKRKEMELQSLKDLADELLPRLEGLMYINTKVISRKEDESKEFIKLIGGLSVFEKVRISLQKAKTQVMEVISGPALPLHHDNLFEQEIGCAERGIKVRIISELTGDNKDVFYDYARHIQIRHLDGVSDMLRYLIVDQREAFVRLNEPPINYSSDFTTLWTNKNVMVLGLCNEFESLWTISKDVNKIFETKTY